jgi:hypothetical protein
MDCQASCFCDITCTGEDACSVEAICPAGCDDAAGPACRTNGQCVSAC